MATEFSEFITSQGRLNLEYLPLVHTMDWKQFVSIMKGPRHLLEAPICDVFDPDKIAYLFYGRPCYKIHAGMGASSNPATDSVCILLDPLSLPEPKRLYPFDSGAFHGGIFSNYVHPTDEKEQFEIEPASENALKLVSLFFGNNKNYFKEVIDLHATVTATDLDVASYLRIAQANSTTHFDSRKSAIEFQIDGDIDLTSVNILGVIVNEDVLDDPNTRNFIENTLGSVSYGYYSPHSRPEEEALVIMNIVKQLCDSEGLL